MRVHPLAQAARGHPHRRVVGCSGAGASSSGTRVATVDSDGSMGGRASGSALEASMVEARRHWGWVVGDTRLAAVVACMVASGP